MARNSVAANLLLVAIVLAGIVGLSRTRQEVYPEFDLDLVTVVVPYPGASPESVESAVLLPLEDAVAGLDGVKGVTSSASEGVGKMGVEVRMGADREAVLADVQGAIDRIRSLPDEAGDPIVALAARHREIISVVVHGDLDEKALYDLARRIERELPVAQAELVGMPEPQITVAIGHEALVAHGLTHADVAAQIRATSVDLPGGNVHAGSGAVLVRVGGRELSVDGLAEIPIASRTGVVPLGEIAEITDGFTDSDLTVYFNGEPAARVVAYRVGTDTPQGVADAVQDYVATVDLPHGASISVWRDDSRQLRERIDLLLRNGASGFVLVLLVLAAFLDIRLAFWVGTGIPVSFLGAFVLLPAADLSVNMITLFAFIVTLGMVVDDAIVVGENVHARREAGQPGPQAAMDGAREVAAPVVFSVLTTIVAFLPLLVIPGVMGKLFTSIPIIVIGVLAVSLVESLFILPAHLAHMKASKGPGRISLWLERFIADTFTPALDRLLGWRYAVVGGAVALLGLTLGAVAGGLVPFTFFPVLEGDVVQAYATLPYGTPVERTQAVRAELEHALDDAIAEVGGRETVQGVLTRVGEGPRTGSYGQRTRATGSHLLTIEVELVSPDDRTTTAADLAAAWRARIPDLALESLVVTAASGPSAGNAVDVQLAHPDPVVLARAADEVRTALAGFDPITNIQSSQADGKEQVTWTVRPEGIAQGVVGADVAGQIRGALIGAEALRAHRGTDEVRVLVRLPAAEREDADGWEVRTRRGDWLPLADVADLARTRAPTEVQREEGRRVVHVVAERKPGVGSTAEVIDALKTEVLPRLQSEYPELQADLAGEQKEQREVFGAILVNYALALFLVYALLAIPFRSYTQPLVIMTAIPFGLIGAVGGHVLMGYELSVISTMGMVALSGVVVNDSLVLIDATNGLLAEGATPHDAIVQGAARRFRPILLTSLTTFFGLVPMITETSVQARFLVPMALSLGFGVLLATVLILLVVPALFLILEDVRGLFRGRPYPGRSDGSDEALRSDPDASA